jgi:hypothetical protein
MALVDATAQRVANLTLSNMTISKDKRIAGGRAIA